MEKVVGISGFAEDTHEKYVFLGVSVHPGVQKGYLGIGDGGGEKKKKK